MAEDDNAIQEYSRSGNNVQLGGVSGSTQADDKSTDIGKWVKFVVVALKGVSYSGRCMLWED